MKAKNTHNIKQWLTDVENKTLALPEFQRRIVWDHQKCESLLEAIINEKPIGIFLLLHVEPTSLPFEIRFIEGVDDDSESLTNSLLLDGQQRITSLFKAFNSFDDQNTFYVKFKTSTDENIEFDEIKTLQKGLKSNDKIIGKPQKEYEEKYIPATILNPTKDNDLIDNWMDEIGLTGDDRDRIKAFCTNTKKFIGEAIIPHFHLPSCTPPESAIDIYLKLNTQSVKLTSFYEAVGLMYSQTNPRRSLLKIIKDIEQRIPSIKEMESGDLDNLFLKIACLTQDKMPTDSAYKKLDFKTLYKSRVRIREGIRWTVNFMNELGIEKGKQLPSSVPLRVLPAIHKVLESQNHSRKSLARKIINRYVWHAFFTTRYEKSANTILRNDFNDLKESIEARIIEEELDIFKLASPTKEAIENAEWPGRKGILGRAILLACQLNGAVDIETGAGLSYPQEENWNLDHIFPRKRLQKVGINPDRALNCMLLNPKTNTLFSDNLPGTRIKNLQERTKTESGKELSLSEIKKRYLKQLIPEEAFNILNSLNDEDISDEDLKNAYMEFTEKRAELVEKRIEKLLKDGEL